MKKVLLVILAAGSAAVASAQIQYGVKAGYNLTTVTQSGSSNVDGLKNKSDFSAGLLASVPLFSTFYLQPEVVYSGQGTSFNDGGVTAKLNYDYINVPVLFQYRHSSGLFAETGPQIGFLISAKFNEDGVPTQDEKSETQSVDFSWAFGIGYKIPNMGLGIDARYNLGLTNLAKDSGDEKVKNSVFQFGLFYMFGGK